MRVIVSAAIIVIGISGAYLSSAQEITNPFEEEIVAFEKQDQENGYQSDFILFVGSSSIRLWENLEKDMKGFKVLNRGFGGAKLSDLNFYWERILADHKPKLVVLYCGENDINDGVSSEETYKRFEKFIAAYKQRLNGTPLIYIAMKPSPARWDKWNEFRETDAKIQKKISDEEQIKYVDFSEIMLGKNEVPKSKIFVSDELHMNERGYKSWKKALRKSITEVLKLRAE